MARIRTIKPEFPQSESMGRVSREARLCFILLWTVADDAGRLRGNSRMLASTLYPFDDDSKDLIDDWLKELELQNCIVRYRSENGDSYIAIVRWRDHQRIDKPTKSRFPEPPVDKTKDDSRGLREDSENVRGGLLVGLEGKGKEGKGVEGIVRGGTFVPGSDRSDPPTTDSVPPKEDPPKSKKARKATVGVFTPPERLNTPEVLSALADWEAMRARKGKPITDRGNVCRGWEARFVDASHCLACIEVAIANEYQGISPEYVKPTNGALSPSSQQTGRKPIEVPLHRRFE